MNDGTKKVALITGANKGIGFETARQLGTLGMTVLLGARDADRGKAAADQLQREGIDARALKLDVVNAGDVKAAAEFVGREFGVLDVLVNNAGVMNEAMTGNTTLEVGEQALRDTFDANFFAVVHLTHALLPWLRRSAAGRIVNVSSILGSLTLHSSAEGLGVMPFAYDASKSALNAYTIHLANALKETKIKVNSAHPGWVKTDMGTDAAPMDVVEGAKTEVALASLPDDGATGGFVHLGKTLPW